MAPAQTITLAECEKLVKLVAGICPQQSFTDSTSTSWMTQFRAKKMTFSDCETGVQAFATSPAFRSRWLRTIDHADIISAWKTQRTATARLMAGGKPLPPPPNPDDPRASLRHQRAVYEALATGRQIPDHLNDPEWIDGQRRRVKALRTGDSGQEGSGLPRTETTQELLAKARKACADKQIPGPGKHPARPTSRTPRAAATHRDPLASTTPLAGAFADMFGDRAPSDPLAPSNPSTWCGRCNRETGEVIKVHEGEQVRVRCCTPDRALV